MTFVKFINRYILWFITIVCLLCASNVKWGGNRWKGIIAFDGKGYYAYLPAIFIYNDLHFKFHDDIEKKYSSENTFYEYRVKMPEGTTNKYFAGTALITMPFFLTAHLITAISGGITDGYSFYYQLFISLAALCYGITGLYFLQKLLRLYSISEKLISFILISIFFGTQLFYYSVFDPSLSHVYSFGIISAFLFFIKRYSIQFKKKDLYLSGLLFGLICLVRPVNGLVILIVPFLCGDRENFLIFLKSTFRKNSGIIISILLFTMIVSIQYIIYYFQTGKLFIDTYVVEHFVWTRPEMINMLFSYKKGLFVYTPLVLLSLSGLIPLYRKKKFSFRAFILFFLIITYVFSCWWNWWYGGSFSARPYTEYMSLFGLLLAFSLSSIRKGLITFGMYAAIIFCIILCQVQTYQYRYFVIHWEKMDMEHYWRVFMRIDQVINQENANKDLLE